MGILGLGSNHIDSLRAADVTTELPPRAKACIYIFLSGGLSQLDSFDLKPNASEEIRGEFKPIATRTPGLQICEHLPQLARRSHVWSLCRSLTHPSNEHSAGHHIMLTGRTDLPPGFNASRPQASDWPSIAAIAGSLVPDRNNLPPVAVLPERLVHNSGRIIPGQFAGMMGARRDPWFIEASPFHAKSYGAYPKYSFDHQQRGDADARQFQAPSLTLPHGLTEPRVHRRLALLKRLNNLQRQLETAASVQKFDRYRQGAVSLLADSKIHWAMDVTRADDRTLERYGRHAFGWSLLMARRLIECGLSLVQVNLGNDETWDTHGNAFPHLKDKLFPPTDQAVSALLDDLYGSGQLEDTLVVMAGEFGRTPKISLLPEHYSLPGRDHWGAVQTVFFAGGGIQGGRVIGASDSHGAFPSENPQTPENLAATIYQALGVPRTAMWHDDLDRPFPIYHGSPIAGLT